MKRERFLSSSIIITLFPCPGQFIQKGGAFCNDGVTVQTGSKLEAFFAAFSRKTRVLRRAVHAKRIGIAARKRYMSTPFEGAWTVTQRLVFR